MCLPIFDSNRPCVCLGFERVGAPLAAPGLEGEMDYWCNLGKAGRDEKEPGE